MNEALALLLLLAQSTAIEESRALREELTKTVIELEQLKREVVAADDLDREPEAIEKLRDVAELGPLQYEVLSREDLSRDGQQLPLELRRVEIRGSGPFDKVHFFTGLYLRRPRLAAVESLEYEATTGEDVRFVVRLRIPGWRELEIETSPDLTQALRADLIRTRLTLELLTAIRERGRETRLLDAVGLFSKEAFGHPIALTSLRFEDDVVMQGLLVGAAAKAALAASLQNAGLRARIATSPGGKCQGFTIHARLDPAFNEDGYTAARPLFDGASAGFCRETPPEKPRHIVVRGATSREESTYALRLRGVDLVDTFRVLNDLLLGNFLIDADVTGLIDLDVFEEAAIDGIFNGLSETGLTIGDGLLRRVRRRDAAPAPPRKGEYSGTPITLTFRDIPRAGVFRILSEVMGRELPAPSNPDVPVHIFASDIPADAILDHLLAQTGKGPAPVRSSSRLATPLVTLEQTGIADLRVVGLARLANPWHAYVVIPGGRLHRLEVGQRLFDGTVEAIDAEKITLVSDARQRTELRLPPPAR